MLPKEIECPKCGGPNPFKNDTCSFCGYKLNKQKYYNIDYYNNVDSLEEDSSTEKVSIYNQFPNTFNRFYFRCNFIVKG